MFDLNPVMLSARSSYVKISDEEKAALSSLRHLDRIACPVVLAYGDGESPEFKRQSREMAAALKAKGKASELIEVKGANHFEIIETLGKPDGALGKAALKQMGVVA
jgi:arylformamidase